MRVSILIPCYNARPWVGEAIASALAQSHADTEVIVVDDGSADGSDRVIAGFADRIRWVRTENRGGNAARNLLLAMASGTWVQYLDADDYLAPGKIAGQVEVLSRSPQCDVLCAPVTFVWDHAEPHGEQLWTFSAPHDPWRLLALWELPQTGAGLWRKAAILDVGGWEEGRRLCQEADLYLRLLAAGKRFCFTDVGGAYYRQRSGSVSKANLAESLRQRLAIVDRLAKLMEEQGIRTPERAAAVSEGRLDCARPLYALDRPVARRAAAAIRADHPEFVPRRGSRGYRLAYRALGFEPAERLAAALRPLRRLRPARGA
jgi:GT2 family glycosyltransferase